MKRLGRAGRVCGIGMVVTAVLALFTWWLVSGLAICPSVGDLEPPCRAEADRIGLNAAAIVGGFAALVTAVIMYPAGADFAGGSRMIDEESRVDPRRRDAETYGEGLLYDFSKFMTTLSILALGGILTLTQTADRSDIKTFNIVMSVVAISLAGTLALTTANSIAYARSSGQPLPRNLHRYTLATMALLGMGMGMFLYMWMDTLN